MTTSDETDDAKFPGYVAERLSGVPGVTAVALGGSRAAGTQRPDSDWDFSLYYRGQFEPQDLRALGWPGEISRIGGWGGGVFNGGAWLRADGRPVDVVAELAVNVVLYGGLPSPGGYPDRLRQAAHERWLADARHTLGYARGAYAGRGRLTETAGAIALAFAQGAHATLAARGEWITNEKALLDRDGFRRADEVLGGLTADPPSLVAAVDAASDLIGEAAG
jgi:predicted nucleotidyltransferase